MNNISAALKGGLSPAVRILNQPSIKEGVKNAVGYFSIAFGLFQLYDFYKIYKGESSISSEANPDIPIFKGRISFSEGRIGFTANLTKLTMLSAKVSLLLSALVSRPSVNVISKGMGLCFSAEQLTHYLGPNSTYEVNPSHPRHI